MKKGVSVFYLDRLKGTCNLFNLSSCTIKDNGLVRYNVLTLHFTL